MAEAAATMQIRTVSLTLSASRDEVFNFLADIENLPKWAAGYCDQIELRHNGWWAYTTHGEMFVVTEADDRTGVIDLRVGPSADELELCPIRVVAWGAGGALASFTIVQPAHLPDATYENHYQVLLLEMQGLIQRFGGGELHLPGARPQHMVLGVN